MLHSAGYDFVLIMICVLILVEGIVHFSVTFYSEKYFFPCYLANFGAFLPNLFLKCFWVTKLPFYRAKSPKKSNSQKSALFSYFLYFCLIGCRLSPIGVLCKATSIFFAHPFKLLKRYLKKNLVQIATWAITAGRITS